MGIDGRILRKDRLYRYFISASFFRVPAKEVIAAACRGRQTFQLSVFSLGAGRAYTAAVGIKGHGVLLSRLLLPMGIDGGVLRKYCIGCYFISTVFLRVPAKEVIAVVGRDGQACQLPVFGGGAGRAYVTAVCIKGHSVLFFHGRFSPLCGEFGHSCGNILTRRIGVSVAAQPGETVAVIPCWAGQALAAGGGEALAGFHNDIHRALSGADLSAIQINRYHVQAVRAQCVRVQDFKHGAETKGRIPIAARDGTPVAGRIVPTARTVQRIS